MQQRVLWRLKFDTAVATMVHVPVVHGVEVITWVWMVTRLHVFPLEGRPVYSRWLVAIAAINYSVLRSHVAFEITLMLERRSFSAILALKGPLLW